MENYRSILRLDLSWLGAAMACALLAGCGDDSQNAGAQTGLAFDDCPADKAAQVVENTKSQGLVSGQEWRRDGIVLLVDPTIWRELGLNGQKTILAMYDCHVAGNAHHLATIYVREDREGPDLFTAHDAELMSWRQMIWPSAEALAAYESGPDGDGP